MSRCIDKWLSGKRGLEIGAGAQNNYRLNALNVSIGDQFFEDHQRSLGLEPSPIHIKADAASIPVDDNSQDFVFSSHMIEHHPNPLKAIQEWYRVVRPKGFIVMVVPQRDALESDKEKPLTDVATQWERYNTNITTAPDVHHSRWTSQTFVEMLNEGTKIELWKLKICEVMDPDDQVTNGFIVVAQVLK